MKLSLHIELFLSMLFVAFLFGITLYKIMGLPLWSHCLLISAIFAVINYLVAYRFYKKYKNLEESNLILNKKLEIDKLTGLFNRATFDSDIGKMTENGLYSMIFIDIDNFREFNNKYGHQIGDGILQKVSSTIKANVRTGDKVYRYGGEEIVVILKDCNKENALKIAEKIRLRIENIDNTPYPSITISLGISGFPEDGENVFEIIEACDSALLKAKNSGKNQCLLYQAKPTSP